MKYTVAPLKTSFLMAGILGFMISIIYLPKYSLNWAFAFGLVFFLMILASFVAMTKADPDIQLYSKPKKIK